MNFSCPMSAFDKEPNHIPWTIFKSKLSLQTTVFKIISKIGPDLYQGLVNFNSRIEFTLKGLIVYL